MLFTKNLDFTVISHSLYRLIWLLLVTGAIAAFCLLVVWRIDAYRDDKTNVAVKINYENSLDFPAVTLCNQNSYR